MLLYRVIASGLAGLALGTGLSGLASSPAEAHIALTSPKPRTSAQKQGPCGLAGSERGDKISTYRPGETITVTWDEEVDHVGHYRIAFDIDGDDDFPTPQFPDDNYDTTLVDQIPDRQGGGGYGQEITFPDEECDNCTLQLIQVMTTRTPYNSFYFQCADIRLSNSGPSSPDADISGVGDTPFCAGCGVGEGQGAGTLLLALLALFPLRRRRP